MIVKKLSPEKQAGRPELYREFFDTLNIGDSIFTTDFKEMARYVFALNYYSKKHNKGWRIVRRSVEELEEIGTLTKPIFGFRIYITKND